jgi:polar amino acid transport system substrate-binding protein
VTAQAQGAPAFEARRGENRMASGLLLRCAAMVLAGSVMLGFAEARSLDDIVKQGVIRVGINPNFPPNSSRNAKGEWEGFDIDIGTKIADAMKVKVEWVPTETPQRVPFLVADKIDISLGALTRNSERAKLIEYTVPLHTEVMAVLTTEKVDAKNWKELNDGKYTLADMRGNWTVDWLKQNMPKAKLELVDTIADTVRLVGQGRADAIVENIDFFMAQTRNYPDVKWKILPDTIDVSYDAIGVQRGNYPLRDLLNIVLFNLHSSNAVNETWEKWYGAPMLVKIVPNPYF